MEAVRGRGFVGPGGPGQWHSVGGFIFALVVTGRLNTSEAPRAGFTGTVIHVCHTRAPDECSSIYSFIGNSSKLIKERHFSFQILGGARVRV